MKNWFKRKSKKEKAITKQVICEDIEKWHDDAEDKRACFAILLDEDEGTLLELFLEYTTKL